MVVLIHGVAESGAVWYGWIPTLTPYLRVIRPDLRGFGRTPPLPRGRAASLSEHAIDVLALLDRLEIQRAHFVGAKYGGAVAIEIATMAPGRILTLTLAGALVTGGAVGRDVGPQRERLGRLLGRGHEGLTRAGQRSRLGSGAPPAQSEWWDRTMASSDAAITTRTMEAAANIDLRPKLGTIGAPTLVITTDRNDLWPLDTVIEEARRIPDSALCVLPGDGYHVAAAEPEVCARRLLTFIRTSMK